MKGKAFVPATCHDPALEHVQLLTATQLAGVLGCHISSVWRLVQRVDDPLPCVRLGTRITRFRLVDVEAWIGRAGSKQ